MRDAVTALTISKVQRFSVDDGPGIRSTVFLKGCNLRCEWCHNPENIAREPELQFTSERCAFCGRCQVACPEEVHSVEQDVHLINRGRCERSGYCASVCPNLALELIGKTVSAEALCAELLKDADFYESSGGGVTFSGGEPMLQHRALRQVLGLCKERGLHTAIDTAGDVPFSSFQEVMPCTDLFLYDLKCFTSSLHESHIGVSNARILRNACLLGEHGASLIVRVPLIAGINDSEREMARLASFISSVDGVELCQLLPYHDYGVGKYATLGKNASEFRAPDEERLQDILEIFSAFDIPARIR